MTWIDIVCLVCIFLFGAIGFWRGLLKSIFRLAAWLFAIIGAYLAQSMFTEIIVTNLNLSVFTVKLICVCFGFLIPFLAISFIGHLIHKAVSDSAISGINRWLGATMGAIKATIICFVFLSILHILPVTGNLKAARNEAFSYKSYKFCLETAGISSKEIDIIGKAEQKASQFSKKITDKAVEKAKNEAASRANEAAINAKEAAKQAVDEVKQKASNTAEEIKNKVKN